MQLDPRLGLEGKIAVVTGVSRPLGIGAAIAQHLAACGVHLLITYYRPYDFTMPWGGDPEFAGSFEGELRSMGVRAAGLEIDLADPEGAAALFDAAEARLGPVDILVNNATHSEPGGIDRLDAGQLDRAYAVNVRAMALLCAEFVRRFHRPNGGRIINLTSGQGLHPMPDELAYIATKGAVEAFTISLSRGVAGRGITVNAVDPGATDSGWMTPELKETLIAAAPTGRVGLPADAARLVRFLASDEAGWITGQVIHSRGGA